MNKDQKLTLGEFAAAIRLQVLPSAMPDVIRAMAADMMEPDLRRLIADLARDLPAQEPTRDDLAWAQSAVDDGLISPASVPPKRSALDTVMVLMAALGIMTLAWIMATPRQATTLTLGFIAALIGALGMAMYYNLRLGGDL